MNQAMELPISPFIIIEDTVKPKTKETKPKKYKTSGFNSEAPSIDLYNYMSKESVLMISKHKTINKSLSIRTPKFKPSNNGNVEAEAQAFTRKL